MVVCLDADVDPSSHLIARLEQCQPERGGLVSVQPYHEMRRWWERAAAFFNLVAIMGVGIGSPVPSPARARAAFGPCLIARREALLTHLGHRSVRRAVIEDVRARPPIRGRERAGDLLRRRRPARVPDV